MRFYIAVTLCTAFTLVTHAQQPSLDIQMTAESWMAEPGQVEFITHRGVPAMAVSPSPEGLFVKSGQVVLTDVEFDNGTIEFDVELTDFFLSAIYFRLQDAENAEMFYLRAYRAEDPTGPDAIQYTTLTNGVALWDVHPDFQAPAIIHKEGWNRIKLVVSDQRMRVYVNDMSSPVMTVPQLMGASVPGQIAFEGGGIFANLVITPDATEGLPDEAAYDPVKDDIQYLHRWEVSAPIELPAGHEMVSAMQFRAYSEHLPSDSTTWHSIESERNGLINLSRTFGRSDNRRAAWLRTTIHSNKEQVRHMDLGFSDEVWVLLNGRLVYVDKNLYSHPIMKDPFGQISIDDASFALPLEEGENELLVGVANSFFGWAIMARLDNVDGVSLVLPTSSYLFED